MGPVESSSTTAGTFLSFVSVGGTNVLIQDFEMFSETIFGSVLVHHKDELCRIDLWFFT